MKVFVLLRRLREKVAANAASHRETFLRAQKVFREKVIEALDANLKLAQEGGEIRMYVNLPTPQDHSDEYGQVLAMLDFSLESGEKSIELSQQDYAKYVLDQWEWKGAFDVVTATYLEGDP